MNKLNEYGPGEPPGQDGVRTPSPKPTDGVALLLDVLLVAMLFAAAGKLVWDCAGDQEVASTQPIGLVKSVSAAGGLRGGVILETETGYYPLLGSITAPKGAAVSLEVRQNGNRYVCDGGRQVCVQTVRDALH